MMTDIGEAVAAQVQENFQIQLNQLDISNNADKLTQGLLQVFQPSLEQMKNELDDLLKKQNILVGKMQLENDQLEETAQDGQCHAMYSMIKSYQEKLSHLKKEMTSIHERTAKLKKRALRLQHAKQKDAIAREEKREEDLRQEEQLIAEHPTFT